MWKILFKIKNWIFRTNCDIFFHRNFEFLIAYKRNVEIQNCSLQKDVQTKGKWITLLISNKKEFNHFFKSRSSDIALLKLGNLYQNAKRYEPRNSEREARSSHLSRRFHRCYMTVINSHIFVNQYMWYLLFELLLFVWLSLHRDLSLTQF